MLGTFFILAQIQNIIINVIQTIVSLLLNLGTWCGLNILASTPSWGRPAMELLSTPRRSPTRGRRKHILQRSLGMLMADGMCRVHQNLRMVETYLHVRFSSTKNSFAMIYAHKLANDFFVPTFYPLISPLCLWSFELKVLVLHSVII